jgi:heptosyltransferase-2
MQLLIPLGIATKTISPKIYLTETEILERKRFLKNHGIDLKKPLYMISILGSGLNKTYPFSYMAQVIDTVANQTNGQLLFNYMPKQKLEAKEILDLCNNETKEHVFFNVFGQSLREFLAITHHCNAVIGNEGGAINMAKALNIRTFSIFSPWISKSAWDLFEDSNNVSVHLKDYFPNIYTKPEKAYKKDTASLYNQFKPALFLDKLKMFLKP